MLVVCAAAAALAAVLVFRLTLPPDMPEQQPDRLWTELTVYVNWLSVTALLVCAAWFLLGFARVVAGVYGKRVPVDEFLSMRSTPVTTAVVVGAVIVTLKNFFWTLKHA